MKRIRIIDNKPKRSDEKSIYHLIGREFDVKEIDEDGVYIGYGETGMYCINEGEYEEVTQTEEVTP